jgi:hypothetical protein
VGTRAKSKPWFEFSIQGLFLIIYRKIKGLIGIRFIDLENWSFRRVDARSAVSKSGGRVSRLKASGVGQCPPYKWSSNCDTCVSPVLQNPCPARVLLQSILNHHKRDARANFSTYISTPDLSQERLEITKQLIGCLRTNIK